MRVRHVLNHLNLSPMCFDVFKRMSFTKEIIMLVETIIISVLSQGKTHNKECRVKSDGSFFQIDRECKRIANKYFIGKITKVSWYYA